MIRAYKGYSYIYAQYMNAQWLLLKKNILDYLELKLSFIDLEKYGFILPKFNPLPIVLLNSYN